MKHGLLALALLALPSLATAQGATVTVAWDYPVLPAVVSTYTQAVLIDGVAQPGTPACAAKTGGTGCQLSMPLPSNAPHVLTVRATLAGAVAESIVNGFNPASGPQPATGVRTTVTIVVSIVP